MTGLASIAAAVRDVPPDGRFGRVVAVRGALVEVEGLRGMARIGSRLAIRGDHGAVEAEVTGLDGEVAHCLTFVDPQGVAAGARADLVAAALAIRPSAAWLGRTIDALARPIDGKGALATGPQPRGLRVMPPPAALRARVGAKLDTGIATIDLFAPLCEGQRLGLFAGSGVGKSTLLAMFARWTECDVVVIGLVGERGREVKEFIEDDLGDALERSVVVAATSDASALMRRQAAWTTLAVAEHFRDQGLRVLCLMDSVTRFAMAQREIALASGEPPATKGYTPTVFAELPRLLERAGPGRVGSGSITAVFAVLVDGDDHDEPVADAVRGILDGHVVISRRIAERGRYPAIDVLRSLSRTLPDAHTPEEEQLRLRARSELAVYGEMEELIRLGAYKSGANFAVDRAIRLAPQIERLITQNKRARIRAEDAFAALRALFAAEPDGDE